MRCHRYAFHNCEAVVLAFTSDSALHLLSWSARSHLSVSHRSGMGGVSDAYFSALFNLPQVSHLHMQALS